MTVSLALAYASIAVLVVACIRLHWRQEKDYWEAYNRGWDRAEETFSSIWPTDSDGDTVLPTFPSSTPPPLAKAPRPESMKGQAVATKERTDGPRPAKAPRPAPAGTYTPPPSPNGMKADVTKVD